MRLCRIGPEGAPRAAFYFDTHVIPVAAAAVAHSQARGTSVRIPTKDDILPLLGDFALHETVAWLAKSTHPPVPSPLNRRSCWSPSPSRTRSSAWPAITRSTSRKEAACPPSDSRHFPMCS